MQGLFVFSVRERRYMHRYSWWVPRKGIRESALSLSTVASQVTAGRHWLQGAVRAKSRAEVAGSHTEREVKEASDCRSGGVPKRGPDEQRWMTCAGSTDGMEACVRIRRHGNPVCILG